ncbi:MAG: T9SS type A sorting domain-containing protein, partial [Bacteroidota bacterium]
LSNLGLSQPLFSLPEIHVFPNPANDKITITSTTDLNNLEILVYSSIGELIEKKIGKLNAIDFTISEYTNGIYFIRIPEFGYTTKFIKQ